MRISGWLEGVLRGSQAKACSPRRLWRDLRTVIVGSKRIWASGRLLNSPPKSEQMYRCVKKTLGFMGQVGPVVVRFT